MHIITMKNYQINTCLVSFLLYLPHVENIVRKPSTCFIVNIIHRFIGPLIQYGLLGVSW